MIYTHMAIYHNNIAKEHYTHHNNMLVHNGVAAGIYGKSLN